MKNLFIPYELALNLKELGFDEECFGAYIYYGKKRGYKLEISIYDSFFKDKLKAPLWEQAFDWLLWKLKHISIDIIYSTAGCELIVEKQKINKYDTKEECLEKLIELCGTL